MTSTEKMAMANASILKYNEKELDKIVVQDLFSEFVHPSERILDSERPRL